YCIRQPHKERTISSLPMEALSYLLAILHFQATVKSKYINAFIFGQLPFIRSIENSDEFNIHSLMNYVPELIRKCNMLSAIHTDHKCTRLGEMVMYNKKNVDYVAMLWEDFMYQADNREISSARKEHMPYPRFTKARIRRIFLDGYGILVVRIVIFKISSFKLQNARLLLIFTKYPDRMSTPTQCWLWDRMGTPTQCDMLCDTFVIGIRANGYREVVLSRPTGYSISKDPEEEPIEEEPLEELKKEW
ncbi:hypothetical protein Tco_0634479, partial [Tanacetum coccineum]